MDESSSSRRTSENFLPDIEDHDIESSGGILRPFPNAGNISNAIISESGQPLPVVKTSQSDEMYNKFNILVLISTFTTALIVAFLSLIAQVLNGDQNLRYEMGFWLSFISAGVHLWVAIVAGRAALLAIPRLDETADGAETRATRGTIHIVKHRDMLHFLALCEQLQLLGTIIFVPSALLLIPLMFVHAWFGISFWAMAGASILFVFRAGFWRVSVLFSNLKWLWRQIHVPKLGRKTNS